MSVLIESLLDRLEGVRRYGKGYRAKCPAHDGKSTTSLSITEGDDGRILLHDFGGCDPLAVISACGLQIADLFPKRCTHYTTKKQRKELRQLARHADWKAAQSMLEFESRVVWVAGKQIKKGEPLNDGDEARVDMAMHRIAESGRILHERNY